MAPRRRTIAQGGKSVVREGVSKEGKRQASARKCRVPVGFLSAVAVLVYVACPFIIHLSPPVQNALVFLNYARPPFTNVSDVSIFNITPARSFFLKSDSETLGVWHILSHGSPVPSDGDWDKTLADGKPVIVYFHGNAGTRGTFHRVELYRVFAKLGYHVVAVDYRGYGDSTGYPQNDTVVGDALATYSWVKARAKGPVFIWGHSLGTGVSIQSVAKLCAKEQCPIGLFLEAPFISVESAATTHPLGRAWSWILKFVPDFAPVFFRTWSVQFNSLETIQKVECPLFVIHSADDAFIDIRSSEQIVAKARAGRKQKDSVEYYAVDGYGHQRLYMLPNLPQLIRNFIKKHTAQA